MPEILQEVTANAEEVKRPPYRLRVTNGLIHREEDGADIKRTGYPKKVAEEIVRRIRSGQEIRLIAISDAACGNMIKALTYAKGYLVAYNLDYETIGFSFEELPPRDEGQRPIIAKTVLIGPKRETE